MALACTLLLIVTHEALRQSCSPRVRQRAVMGLMLPVLFHRLLWRVWVGHEPV